MRVQISKGNSARERRSQQRPSKIQQVLVKIKLPPTLGNGAKAKKYVKAKEY